MSLGVMHFKIYKIGSLDTSTIRACRRFAIETLEELAGYIDRDDLTPEAEATLHAAFDDDMLAELRAIVLIDRELKKRGLTP